MEASAAPRGPLVRRAIVGYLSVVLAMTGVPSSAGATGGAAAPSAVETAVPSAREGVARAAAGVRLTIRATHAQVRRGERIWIVGKVKGSTTPRGRTVKIQRRKVGTSAWKTYTTDRTSSTGRYSVSIRPTGVYDYRAHLPASSGERAATSAARRVSFDSGKRTLAARAASLGSNLGAPTGRVRTLSAAQRRATKIAGARSIAYRPYRKGLLVKVTTAGSTSTWVVTGKIRKAYERAGGPTGRYGVPVIDAKCGLLENGCVQRFSRGTLYSSSYRAAATGTAVRGNKGEVIAAARSQVGYRYRFTDSTRQRTRFNVWMGNRNAWCSFLQSWASSASGNGATIPKSRSFKTFVADVRRTMPTGSKPRVGALVFFNTYAPAGRITHTGLVVAVGKDTIRVVDGNTNGNLPAKTRGVLERSWPQSRALMYAYPDY